MIKIGVICPSEIAFRRYMPAIQKAEGIQYVGVGVSNAQEWFGEILPSVSEEKINRVLKSETEKAQSFIKEYGGCLFHSYEDLISDNSIDAVYLPLPPALHYKWAKLALEHGKHIFLEKPSTTCYDDTVYLINQAKKNSLAVHENYMFVYHNQIADLNHVIDSGEIGDVRLIRISFGFPLRQPNDFRYNKALGGGALLDAGGYTMKYASLLLGETARLTTAQANYIEGYGVEMFASATMVNDKGLTAQLSFGMDNDYKCDVEIWGSKGSITSGRILTAPAGFTPTYTIKKNQNYETRDLSEDDAFLKSINMFVDCCHNEKVREDNYVSILRQIKYVDDFRKLARI